MKIWHLFFSILSLSLTTFLNFLSWPRRSINDLNPFSSPNCHRTIICLRYYFQRHLYHFLYNLKVLTLISNFRRRLFLVSLGSNYSRYRCDKRQPQWIFFHKVCVVARLRKIYVVDAVESFCTPNSLLQRSLRYRRVLSLSVLLNARER